MNPRKTLLGLVIVIAAIAGLTARADADEVGRLLDLMSKRLGLVAEQAKYTWANGVPAQDTADERRILRDVAEQASAQDLPQDLAENFFGSQITAAGIVRKSMYDKWEAAGQGSFESDADREAELNSNLDAMTPVLLDALKIALPHLRGKTVRQRLIVVPDRWSGVPEAWDAAIAPLMPLTVGEQ
ncbi:MAG: hypothetical protein GY791_01440 [Alphaproteobacteria bacterium]|nr:hypothetical protein [Alphaproteobacteria bacterium]